MQSTVLDNGKTSTIRVSIHTGEERVYRFPCKIASTPGLGFFHSREVPDASVRATQLDVLLYFAHFFSNNYSEYLEANISQVYKEHQTLTVGTVSDMKKRDTSLPHC